jgi:hypothetical protein
MTFDLNWFEKLVSDVFSPGRFFVKQGQQLLTESPIEEAITWEVFRGQLLDKRHTRREESFFTAQAKLVSADVPAGAPLLSLRFAGASAVLHITRWLHCRIWEAVDAKGAIDTVEVERWIEELVGSVELEKKGDYDTLVDQVRELIFHAAIGLSRLPLNSVETPLPAFSLGNVGYFPASITREQPITQELELLSFVSSGSAKLPADSSRRLELFLRSADAEKIKAGVEMLSRQFAQIEKGERELLRLLRSVFNQTSLTPYTNFVDNSLSFARNLLASGALGLESFASFLFGLMRQTVYHLTAYDLENFHHLGANYPDALMLEKLLNEAFELDRNHPEVLRDESQPIQVRRRRRALLLGWWQYRLLSGLPVPDAPTSPGENRRILPAPHQAVPEIQLTQIGRRTKRLFDQGIDFDTQRDVLVVALQEFNEPELLLELGTALYLDRPFGSARPPATLDLTPLLSYQLFSRNVVRSRLRRIGKLEPGLAARPGWAEAENRLEALAVAGIPAPAPTIAARTVRLQDCWRSADDYLIRRATPETIRQLRSYFRWDQCQPPLRDWHERGLLPVPMPCLTLAGVSKLVFFDQQQQIVAECEVSSEFGFQRRGALELPLPGLTTVQDGKAVVIESCFPKR